MRTNEEKAGRRGKAWRWWVGHVIIPILLVILAATLAIVLPPVISPAPVDIVITLENSLDGTYEIPSLSPRFGSSFTVEIRISDNADRDIGVYLHANGRRISGDAPINITARGFVIWPWVRPIPVSGFEEVHLEASESSSAPFYSGPTFRIAVGTWHHSAWASDNRPSVPGPTTTWMIINNTGTSGYFEYHFECWKIVSMESDGIRVFHDYSKDYTNSTFVPSGKTRVVSRAVQFDEEGTYFVRTYVLKKAGPGLGEGLDDLPYYHDIPGSAFWQKSDVHVDVLVITSTVFVVYT
jgi:hypothetical protein